MKKKELEILLQKVPSFEKPVPHFEQYLTPASIAADIIFTAHQFGDIENKTVIDLGCGTGIFFTIWVNLFLFLNYQPTEYFFTKYSIYFFSSSDFGSIVFRLP